MMDYRIVEKDHINEGRILTVQIPDEQLDKNALYTMEEDMPSFIVPFSYQNIDGEIEISYRMGSYVPLKYYSGGKTVSEYCDLFKKILQPLQNCADWFMKPLNFVLEADRVFYHVATQSIAYLYIPSKESCSSSHELLTMVKQLNKMFPADSDHFRVKVLESFEEFRVSGFLEILKAEVSSKESEVAVKKQSVVIPAVPEIPGDKQNKTPEKSHEAVPDTGSDWADVEVGRSEDDSYDDLEIAINHGKKTGQRGAQNRGKKDKKKPEKEEKPKGGIFGGFRAKKEKTAKQEQLGHSIMKGAGLEDDAVVNRAVIEDAYTKDAKTYIDQKTQLGAARSTQPKLVYVGHENMPREIRLEMTEGQIFKIGRYDISIGKKQCDFEFPHETKAVSRRHAVIELEKGDYYLADIGSAAGTRLDGEELTVSRRYLLKEGARVSFGTEGADYVFRK